MTGEGKAPVYLFVMGQMHLGGIETVALQILNEMAAAGDELVLAGDVGPWGERVHPAIRILPCRDLPELLALAPRALRDRLSGRDIVYATLHPWALFAARLLADRLASVTRSARSFHLVTHSRAFFFDTKFPLSHTVLKRAFFSAPGPSTFFMNDAALKAHAEHWRQDLSAYPVLTLPLPRSEVRWEPAGGEQLRLVSIGRLVAFKGYNRAIPAIVRELREAGLDVGWDIWGYGPDEALIAEEIARSGLSGHVRLRGGLDHQLFDRTVASYDLFVGMGSSLLEAGRLGMPAITAVEGSRSDAYGFLFETPSDSVGDVVPGARTIPLATLLEHFARLSKEERIAVGQRCKDDALRRSASLDDVCEAVRTASPWTPQVTPLDRLLGRAILGGRRLLAALRSARAGK